MSPREPAAAAGRPATGFDPGRVRADFPILAERINGHPLAYLDNAATTQKPLVVMEAIDRFYRSQCSNVHRGLHQLAARATEAYEEARIRVQRFLGAREPGEVIFTSGTTGGINLVARSFGDQHVGAGDEVLITELEHHSNIVPWQMLCERRSAKLRVVPIDDAGELRLDELERLLGPRTRLLAVSHVSNALGTRNPVERIVEIAHANGTPVLIDGAQALAHETVDVARLGCDFYAASAHKAYGPTGIGVLYGRAELLESMPPLFGGGDMIRTVTFERSTWNDLPYKFEAGTPPIAAAIGFGAAVDYLRALGPEPLAAYERELLTTATRALSAIDGLRLIGTARDKHPVLSFTLEGIHPHDVGTVLDHDGVAVRAGHHCAQPLMARFGLPATVRASFGCYNTPQEIEALVRGIERAIEVLG